MNELDTDEYWEGVHKVYGAIWLPEDVEDEVRQKLTEDFRFWRR